MIIEIRMAGFVNKGAELMLHAVIEKLKERYPDAKLTMSPIFGGASDTFEKMQELQLYPKFWCTYKRFNFARFENFIPSHILNMYGLVRESDIDVVIDAAGFAYSDQWGTHLSRELCSSSTRWRKNGTKFIMLPQALGPYKKDNISKYVKKWACNADLIFSREFDSYQNITDVTGTQEKIKCFPDFTNLLKGTLPIGYDCSDKRVALVPNYRMIDKTNKLESAAYLPFMIKCAKYLVEQGMSPFILVHEGENDQMLAESISEAVGGIPIVKEVDPLHIKGILGTCDATVGSRFHGLVSALSQGVPSLATGWSHKYIRLFEDYDFREGVISVLEGDDVLHEKLNELTASETAESMRLHLQEVSEKLKIKSEEMWNIVFNEIDNNF
jgi:polysaccharide pyruvyl transferase WcaK-like protein